MELSFFWCRRVAVFFLLGSSIVHAHSGLQDSGLRGSRPFENEDEFVHDVDGVDVIDDKTESAVGFIVHFRVEKCAKMFIAIDDRRE